MPCGAFRVYDLRRYYVLRNNVVEKVLKLLGRRERWLALAAVRFLRTCIGLKDDFYNRYLVLPRAPFLTHPRFCAILPSYACNVCLLPPACIDAGPKGA